MLNKKKKKIPNGEFAPKYYSSLGPAPTKEEMEKARKKYDRVFKLED